MLLGSHCAHIGCHWAALGGWVVTFGPLGLHLGRSWKLLGLILRSFGVILGALGISNGNWATFCAENPLCSRLHGLEVSGCQVGAS